jgi:CRP-like cAMP-binding protein
MKTKAPPPDPAHRSVVQQMLDTPSAIPSIAECKRLIDIFPEDADLQRRFGDLLSADQQTDSALAAYNQAAGLYLEAGLVLQSIVAKILAWSLTRPSHREGRRFHNRIREKGGGDVPAQLLFSQLAYEEMVSLMLRLSRMRLSPGEIVYDAGQEARNIYFIVSGQLSEILPAKRNEASHNVVVLAENDIFGDIFPLEEASFCRGKVKAVTAAELVKIAKPALKALCYRYPRIRDLLERLSRVRMHHDRDRSWKTVRRSRRYCLPADVQLAFHANGNRENKVVRATARDLSTGGVCVALPGEEASHPAETFPRGAVELKILEGSRTVIDQLTGNVAWRKTVGNATHPTHIAGIAFDSMPQETEIALNAFCTISDGEQDMIWNLWNHLVRP